MRSILAIAVLASGCLATSVDTGFTRLQSRRAAIAPDRVELVFSGHVDRPYVELGLTKLTMATQLAFVPEPSPTQGEVIGKLRALGASNGCDALLVNPTAYDRSMQIVSAVCIAYR